MPENAIKRFWKKVHKTEDCWNWIGSTDGRGRYGNVWVSRGVFYRAHRFSWIIAGNINPGKLCVLHKCDNTHCVRPSHLFLGTQPDNMRDMKAKCRFKPRSSFNEKDVLDICKRLRNGQRPIEIARTYGVKHYVISAISQRRNWRWILDAHPELLPPKRRRGDDMIMHG
jgi:hypothetical protein